MASPNTFLQNLKPTPAPTKSPLAGAPNYLGAAGGLIGGLIKNIVPKGGSLPATPPANTNNSFISGYMGQQAKAPEQNIKPVATTIQASQVKTVPTQPSPTSKPAGTPPPDVNPNAKLQTQGLDGSQPQYSSSGGAVLPQVTGQTANTPNTAQPTPQAPAPTQGQPSPYQANSGLYGQLIAGLANRSQQPGQQYSDAYKQAQLYNQQIEQSKMNQANAEATNRMNPIPIGDQTGREAVIRNQYGQQQNALAGQFQGATNLISGANTQQGLLQSLMQSAASGAAPVQVSPGNYLASPLQGGAASAAEGQQQGNTAATNWAIAQQNIQQGRTYQGQAQDISNSLQLLQTIRPQLTSFMQQAGLNPATAPILNEQINKIDAQANPAAYRTMNALVAEATSFVQQMLQSQGGMTPTDAGNLVASYHLDNLTPNQLDILMQNMEVAGNYRLSQAQSASQAGYSANQQVGAPAQGADATQGQLQTGGANQLNNLPDWLKVLGGIGTGVVGGAAGALQNTASSAIAGGIGGATGGLAEKVLGI